MSRVYSRRDEQAEVDALERAVEEEYEHGELFSLVQTISEWLMLKTALLNEKGSPELMFYETQAVQTMKEKLDEQEVKIEELAVDPAKTLERTVMQMEVDRIRYVLVEYLRTRLKKIQKYAAHLVTDMDKMSKLSEEEIKFAKGYLKMNKDHMTHLLLGKIPKFFQKLDENGKDGQPNMVRGPDLTQYVCGKVTDALGPTRLEDGSNVTLNKDDIIVIRYKLIQELVHKKRITLI